jgi:hypothetical protein
MLLATLKRNNFIALGVCLLLLFAEWFPRLFLLTAVPAGAMRQAAEQSLWGQPFFAAPLFTWLAFSLTFISAWLFLVLNNRHLFHPTSEYLLLLLYILFASAIPATQRFSGAQAAAVCILTGLYHLLAAPNRSSGLAKLFIAGFCFSLAALCFPPALLLLLLLPVAIVILRSFSWRDWVVMGAAVLTPFAYALLYYWLSTHDMAAAHDAFVRLLPNAPQALRWNDTPSMVFFGCTALVTLISLVYGFSGQAATKVRIVHVRLVFLWLLVFAAAALFFYPSYHYRLMPVLALPVTVITANYFAQPGRRKMKTACWLLLLAAVAYVQVAEFL